MRKILISSAPIGSFTPHTTEHDEITRARRDKPMAPIVNMFPPVVGEELYWRVNRRLITTAPRGKNARHDAKSRAYFYQISTRKAALSKRFVWWIKEPLDVARMQQAAALIAGRHDFVAFRAADPHPEEYLGSGPGERHGVYIVAEREARRGRLVGAAIGVGLIGMKASEAVGRNPGAATKILVQAILSTAFAEGIVFFAIYLAH